MYGARPVRLVGFFKSCVGCHGRDEDVTDNCVGGGVTTVECGTGAVPNLRCGNPVPGAQAAFDQCGHYRIDARVCIVIAALFAEVLLHAHLKWFIGALFTIAMLVLVVGLAFFLREVHLAMKSLLVPKPQPRLRCLQPAPFCRAHVNSFCTVLQLILI